MVRRPANDQKANHCKKSTMVCGKYLTTWGGSGNVTTMIGKKIALMLLDKIAKTGTIELTGEGRRGYRRKWTEFAH
jgi:hypothetical protein